MKKYILILAVSVFLTSCKDFKKSIDDTLTSPGSAGDSVQTQNLDFQSTESSNTENIPFTSQSEKLELAEQQLRDLPRFKGNSIYLYQHIHFYPDGRIIAKFQTPENPDFVDEYTYRDGQWQEPEPVILSKNDDVQADLINLDQFPFKNVYNVFKVLAEKDKEIGSHNENQVISASRRKNRIVWQPGSIENERYRYDIEYNEDGTLKSFEQR